MDFNINWQFIVKDCFYANAVLESVHLDSVTWIATVGEIHVLFGYASSVKH